MNAARHLGAGKTVNLRLDREGTRSTNVPVLSLHTHNGLSQVWLELGLPGIVASLVLLIGALRWIDRTAADRWNAAAALATFGSGFLIFQLSYGIWQGWWQSAIWIAVALTAAIVGGRAASAGTENR